MLSKHPGATGHHSGSGLHHLRSSNPPLNPMECGIFFGLIILLRTNLGVTLSLGRAHLPDDGLSTLEASRHPSAPGQSRGRHRVRTRYDRRGLWLVALYGLVLMAHPGHAAMRKLQLEEIARQADTIVLGTVTHQESAWDAHHTAIHTDVTVAVERALVGSQDRIAGGLVGSMGMRTSVDPVLR